MPGVARLEKVVHVVTAKPIAWTLYAAWLGAKWVGRRAVRFGRWVRSRLTEVRQKKGTRAAHVAGS